MRSKRKERGFRQAV